MKRIKRSQAVEILANYGAYLTEAQAAGQPVEREPATNVAGGTPGAIVNPESEGSLIVRLANTVAKPKARKIFIVKALILEYGDDEDDGSRTQSNYAVAAMNENAARRMVEDVLGGGEYRILSVEVRDNPWLFSTGGSD